MEIVNSNCATLSNMEVLNHLQRLKDSRRKQKGQLATITYETLRYLESTPCAHQDDNTIKGCMKELEPYNLNKTEKLMLINTPPTTDLEIQLMIEDSEERLSEKQVKQILLIMLKYFPHIQKESPEQEEEQDGQE